MPNQKAPKKTNGKEEGAKTVKRQNKTELAAQQALESVKNNRQRLKRFLCVLFIVGIATGLALYFTNKKQSVIAKVSVPVQQKKPQVLGQSDAQPDNGIGSSPITVSTLTNQAVSKSTAATTPRSVAEEATQAAPLLAPLPVPIDNTVANTPTPPINTTEPSLVTLPSIQPLVVTVNHVIDQTLHLISLR